jgi:hypothetical protein
MNITVLSSLAAKINLNTDKVVFSVFLTSNLWLALMSNQLTNDNVSAILEQVIAHVRDRYLEAQRQRYFGWWGIHRTSIMQNHCLRSKDLLLHSQSNCWFGLITCYCSNYRQLDRFQFHCWNHGLFWWSATQIIVTEERDWMTCNCNTAPFIDARWRIIWLHISAEIRNNNQAIQIYIYIYIHRVIQKKKVHFNMYLILNSYRDRALWIFRPNSVRFCLWGRMKSDVYKRKVDTWYELLARILDAATRIKKREDQLRRTIRDLRTRVAKCVEVDGGILELIAKCNKFVISV